MKEKRQRNPKNGHDRRYAINCGKLCRELNWEPKKTFESGIFKTIQWYLGNPKWIESIRTGEYRTWIEKNYQARSASLSV